VNPAISVRVDFVVGTKQAVPKESQMGTQKKQHKKYTDEFKRKVVEASHKTTVEAASQKYGVGESTVWEWRKKLKGKPAAKPAANDDRLGDLRWRNPITIGAVIGDGIFDANCRLDELYEALRRDAIDLVLLKMVMDGLHNAVNCMADALDDADILSKADGKAA
jgi:hypothetical protein